MISSSKYTKIGFVKNLDDSQVESVAPIEEPNWRKKVCLYDA